MHTLPADAYMPPATRTPLLISGINSVYHIIHYALLALSSMHVA